MCASPLSLRRLLPGIALLYTVVFFISLLSGVPLAGLVAIWSLVSVQLRQRESSSSTGRSLDRCN